MPSYTVQTGRNRPACLGLVQHDGNRGRRSVIPVLWQGGSVVDRFEVKKTSEGGSPELSTVLLAGDGEPVTEARARG
jgi:hypothetical protein